MWDSWNTKIDFKFIKHKNWWDSWTTKIEERFYKTWKLMLVSLKHKNWFWEFLKHENSGEIYWTQKLMLDPLNMKIQVRFTSSG